MSFSELVRLVEREGFRLVKEKGSIRYYGKEGIERLIRIDYHGSKEVPTGTCSAIAKGGWDKEAGGSMIDLKYSLVVEATDDPSFFGFYSPDLEGFTGVGHSVEDCLYKARTGMAEHVALLRERGLPIPQASQDAKVTIQNAKPVPA